MKRKEKTTTGKGEPPQYLASRPFTSSCMCGWWSIDKRYNAAYHKQVHGCTERAKDN